jgi:hypothetical protein
MTVALVMVMNNDNNISAGALVKIIQGQIMVRAGEVVTPELALERARNIVQGLVGLTVK